MIQWLAAVALVAAKVYTGSGEPLENATVLIQGQRVAAVGRDLALPEGVRVLRLEGAVVTPGLIDPASRLGVREVAQVSSTVEGTARADDDPVRAALRVEDSFDPFSFVIPWARAGGVTSAVVLPAGGLVSGRAIWVDLVEREPVRESPAALLVSLRAFRQGRGERARAFLRLREVLEDAHLFRANRGPYIARRLRALSLSAADLEVLAAALDGELRVLFEVDRAADIRTVLGIIREYRLRAALLGASEGWVVADEIAAAGVPVLMDPLADLPASFDRLQSREDAALLLHRAGVPVAFTMRGGAQRVHHLRHLAGNAVANGFPYTAALAAITRVPAEIFGIPDAGRIAPGALANLVVWNGDPLELGTWPTRLFLRGESVSLRSRPDRLTGRYLRE